MCLNPFNFIPRHVSTFFFKYLIKIRFLILSELQNNNNNNNLFLSGYISQKNVVGKQVEYIISY